MYVGNYFTILTSAIKLKIGEYRSIMKAERMAEKPSYESGSNQHFFNY